MEGSERVAMTGKDPQAWRMRIAGTAVYLSALVGMLASLAGCASLSGKAVLETKATKPVGISKAKSAAIKRKEHATKPPQPAPTAKRRRPRRYLVIPLHGRPYRGQALMTHGAPVKEHAGLMEKLVSRLREIVPSADAAVPIPDFRKDLTFQERKGISCADENDAAVDDYLLGYYKRVLYTRVGKSRTVVLNAVSILKDHALANHCPALEIYRGKRRRIARLRGKAKLYVHGRNMLYRWKAAPRDARRYGIRGVDILLPELTCEDLEGRHRVDAQFYYGFGRRVYVAKKKMQFVVPRRVPACISFKETLIRAWNPKAAKP